MATLEEGAMADILRCTIGNSKAVGMEGGEEIGLAQEAMTTDWHIYRASWNWEGARLRYDLRTAYIQFCMRHHRWLAAVGATQKDEIDGWPNVVEGLELEKTATQSLWPWG